MTCALNLHSPPAFTGSTQEASYSPYSAPTPPGLEEMTPPVHPSAHLPWTPGTLAGRAGIEILGTSCTLLLVLLIDPKSPGLTTHYNADFQRVTWQTSSVSISSLGQSILAGRCSHMQHVPPWHPLPVPDLASPGAACWLLRPPVFQVPC